MNFSPSLVNKVLLLDWGHGAFDENGMYHTPGKRFWHGHKHVFHKQGWFFEGVWNQEFTLRVAHQLDKLKIPYILLNREDYDMPLRERVEICNWWGKRLSGDCFGISNHANASASHRAWGHQVHTTIGITRADELATLHWDQVNELLGKPGLIRMRKDAFIDGDPDYEDQFYILRKTTMPFILVEWLFFDYLEDAQKLMDEKIINLMVAAQVEAVYHYSIS
ncbi:MAG: N-acetylmuramoyl-L-alanine amidase [Bacteroidota bacterium]